MAGISDVAPLKLENDLLYNGKELNHKEFRDNTGLDWYSYGMREYDPQIGRFFRVDPLASKFPYLTPYQYASNEPIRHIDLDGLEEAESPEMYGINPSTSEGEAMRQITTFEMQNSDGKTESLTYFEPQDDPTGPQITKGNKMGKAVVEMTKGIEALKNHIESITEKQDIFIDADGNESVRYESPIIQFKDKASEDALKKLQDAYEGKIQTMINNIPKPQAPGPNATEIEKEEYLNERLQYGINAGLTKAVMEINSPRQELINSLMNDSHTKKEPVTVEPLPLIRRNDR